VFNIKQYDFDDLFLFVTYHKNEKSNKEMRQNKASMTNKVFTLQSALQKQNKQSFLVSDYEHVNVNGTSTTETKAEYASVLTENSSSTYTSPTAGIRKFKEDWVYGSYSKRA
jgi:hypothetical protein